MSKNAKQVELAKQVLAMFVENGEDMSESRHVIHYFYDGNFEALGASLKELGYQVRPTIDDDGVVAERYDVICEDWRTTTLYHLSELADNYGVNYDGWEAAMKHPEQPLTRKEESNRSNWFSKLFGKKS